MVDIDADIIIVGAGPAGCSTALHLAEFAPELVSRTVILEKSHHPRAKLCGGAMLEDGYRILGRLDLDPLVLERRDVDQVHMLYEGRGPLVKPQSSDVVFRVFDRAVFDCWLAKQTRERGFVIEEGVRVTKVVPRREWVEVTVDDKTYRARAVVGADGSLSVVRRGLVSDKTGGTARLVGCYLEDVPATAWESTRNGELAIFNYYPLSQGIQGYTWIFPMMLNGRLAQNRGIFDLNTRKGPRKNLRSVFEESLLADGIDPKTCQIKGHPIRYFAAEGTFSAPGILLVGDAAGVDPAYGEGISLALGYGELAARELAEAFSSNDFSFSGFPKRVLKSEMGKSLMRRTRLARLIYNLPISQLQRLIWWRLGFLVRWYSVNYLLNWTL